MLKKFVLGGMVVVAALLGNACGDDGSSESPAGPADSEVTLSSSSEDVISGNGSSSSVTESPSTSSGQAPQSAESDGSSSSEKAVDGSSSSDGKASSSSGKVEFSSSGKGEKSSSSEKAADSSSSDVVAESSSSEKSSSSVAESSSSVESSSSEVPSSSSVVESSSSVAESSSSLEIESSSSIALSSSSETPTVKSIYDAENNTLTDLRDNKVYKTVTIGEQIWTAENMNYKYKAGSKSFCYNNSEKYCSLYGRLYTSDSKNVICPEKWHLPDSTEWEILFKFTGNQTSVLKADSGWSPWGKENTNGTNDFGFSVYPAGYKTILDGYTGLGEDAWFWVRKGYWIPYIPGVNRTPPDFVLSDDYKALPIRCIKDSE